MLEVVVPSIHDLPIAVKRDLSAVDRFNMTRVQYLRPRSHEIDEDCHALRSLPIASIPPCPESCSSKTCHKTDDCTVDVYVTE
jgi:hypothetical protein